MPKRIQIVKPTDEQRADTQTVWVGPGSNFETPFIVSECRAAGFRGTDRGLAERCVSAFKVWMGPHWRENWSGQQSEARRGLIKSLIPYLRGKDLACDCPLDMPCHGDVLLAMANEGES